jgi:hypothetical protein
MTGNLMEEKGKKLWATLAGFANNGVSISEASFLRRNNIFFKYVCLFIYAGENVWLTNKELEELFHDSMQKLYEQKTSIANLKNILLHEKWSIVEDECDEMKVVGEININDGFFFKINILKNHNHVALISVKIKRNSEEISLTNIDDRKLVEILKSPFKFCK